LAKPRVVIDTSVLVEFLRGSRSASAAEAERLIRLDRAVLCGMVRTELLAGARNKDDRRALDDALSGLHYLEMSVPAWTRAGDWAAALRARGRTVPVSDLVVAALAAEHGCPVLTNDRHFQFVPGLTLHQPE